MNATPTAATPTPEELAARDFYQKPEHGWTCFHCGETFTTIGLARDHFGFDPSAEPGCRIKVGAERGLLMALRKAEKECADAWFAIHNETTDAAKAHYAASARHQEQLRTAEEAGYERGLRDGGEAQRAEIERLTKERDRARKHKDFLLSEMERLTYRAGRRPEGYWEPYMLRAAIDTLKRHKSEAEAALSASQERERVMREALTQIARSPGGLPDEEDAEGWATLASDRREIARAALAKEATDVR